MKTKILLIILSLVLLTLFACKQEIKQVNESNKTEQANVQVEINKTEVINKTETEVKENLTEVKEEETKIKESEETETKTEMKTAIIKIKDLRADPYELNITVGTTVVWINYDNFGHVIAIPKLTTRDEIKQIREGESWNYTFQYEGRYGWYSTPWPQTQGWINVK